MFAPILNNLLVIATFGVYALLRRERNDLRRAHHVRARRPSSRSGPRSAWSR